MAKVRAWLRERWFEILVMSLVVLTSPLLVPVLR